MTSFGSKAGKVRWCKCLGAASEPGPCSASLGARTSPLQASRAVHLSGPSGRRLYLLLRFSLDSLQPMALFGLAPSFKSVSCRHSCLRHWWQVTESHLGCLPPAWPPPAGPGSVILVDSGPLHHLRPTGRLSRSKSSSELIRALEPSPRPGRLREWPLRSSVVPGLLLAQAGDSRQSPPTCLLSIAPGIPRGDRAGQAWHVRLPAGLWAALRETPRYRSGKAWYYLPASGQGP